MPKTDYAIGADVQCTDGTCGKLKKLVVDPHTRRVTDLVVEKGMLLKRDRVIPISAAEETSREGVRVALSKEEIEKHPEYREDDYVVPAYASDREEEYEEAPYITWTGGRLGALYPRAVVSKVQPVTERVREGVATGRALIARGTEVRNVGGKIGEMDHVLVDQETGELTHLVVRRSPLMHSVVIPASEVESIAEDRVFVSAGDDDLEEMPCYMPRAGEDLLSELKDRLSESSCQLTEEPAVEEGVVRLSGVARDVETKRRAEVSARSVSGVLDVENALDTDTAIMARVSSALLEDPRTELATIGVDSDRGVVTLRGAVESPQVRSAAMEIARQQPGVVAVDNEMEVRPREDSGILGSRAAHLGIWPPRGTGM